MIRPPFAARVVTGLIVTAIEETRKLPSTAVTLPMTAVSQTLQAGMRFQQGIAELAIKGDEALDAIFHRAEEEPEWATFDDDVPADVTHDPKHQPGTTASVTPITAASSATVAAPAESATPGHLPTGPDEPTPADMPAEQADTVEPTPPAPAKKAPAKKAAAKKAPAKKAAKKAAPRVADTNGSSASTDPDEPAPPNTGRFALYSSAPENVVRSDVEATPVAPSADAPEIVEYLDYDGLTLAQLRSKIRTVDIDDLRALADYERSHRGRAPFQTMLDNRITAATGK